MKQTLAENGRDISIAPAIYPVVAETQAEAEDKFAVIDALAKPIDSLALLSEVLNFDFASKPIDEPFNAEELKSISGLQAIRDRVVQLSGKPNPTVRDFVEFSGRGRLRSFRRSSDRRRRSPTSSRNGSPAAPATASLWLRPMYRAPMTTSCSSWFPSCSAAGCSSVNIRETRCGRIRPAETATPELTSGRR